MEMGELGCAHTHSQYDYKSDKSRSTFRIGFLNTNLFGPRFVKHTPPALSSKKKTKINFILNNVKCILT